MSDMLLEVEDALRAQQIKALWDKFGQWLIGAALVAILGTAIGVTWHNHTNKVLAEQSSELMTFLRNDSDGKASSKELADISAKTDMPLQAITELYQAQKFEKAEDFKSAQDTYKTITKQSGAPDIVQDLARLHFVRIGVSQNQKSDDLMPMLDKLTKDDGAFRASALELKGLLLQQQGKNEEANKVFVALSKEENIPGNVRNRAKAMIRYEDKNAK